MRSYQRSAWRPVCALVLISPSLLLFAPRALSQAAPGKMVIKKEKALAGDYLYWFVAPGLTPTLPLQLPAEMEGTILLDIPTEYNLPNAQLEILDMKQGRVAHFAVSDMREKVQQMDSPLGPNLLRVPAGNQGIEQWMVQQGEVAQMVVDLPNEASLPPGVDGKVVRCNVTTAADKEKIWQAQFAQNGLDLADGQEYMVTFWARADHARPMTVVSQIDQSDYHMLGLSERVELATDWHKYALHFTPTHTVKGHNRLGFQMGETTGAVELVGLALQASQGKTPRAVASNLLTNGNFAQGTSLWNLEVNAATVKASQEIPTDASPPPGVSGKVLRLHVDKIDDQNWHVQANQMGLDLVEGAKYTVTFWARAEPERDMTFLVGADTGDYHPSGLNSTVKLGPDWSRFTTTFTAAQVVKQHSRLNFTLGTAVGTVDLAGVSMQQVLTGMMPKSSADLTAFGVPVAVKDFQYVQTVRIPVKYKNMSVLNASVTLEGDGKSLGEYSLNPTDKGEARFDDVSQNAKLLVTVRLKNQTAQFVRIIPPDTGGYVETIDLPEGWTDVKTDASAGNQPFPLIGAWESAGDIAAQKYRFTFNADGTGSIQVGVKVNPADGNGQINAFTWRTKKPGQRIIIATREYIWAITEIGKEQKLTLTDQNGKARILYRKQ